MSAPSSRAGRRKSTSATCSISSGTNLRLLAKEGAEAERREKIFQGVARRHPQVDGDADEIAEHEEGEHPGLLVPAVGGPVPAIGNTGPQRAYREARTADREADQDHAEIERHGSLSRTTAQQRGRRHGWC